MGKAAVGMPVVVEAMEAFKIMAEKVKVVG